MNNNNIHHQLIIQDENERQLAKAIEISNGQTNDFTLTFSNIENINIIVQVLSKNNAWKYNYIIKLFVFNS